MCNQCHNKDATNEGCHASLWRLTSQKRWRSVNTHLFSLGKEPGFEVKGSASLLADDVIEDVVHLMLSVWGLKAQHAAVPGPNVSEDLMESILEIL